MTVVIAVFYYFQISYGEVMGKTLVLAVFDFDRFSKHDAIGEVRLPVCQLDLASSVDRWKELASIQGDGVVSHTRQKRALAPPAISSLLFLFSRCSSWATSAFRCATFPPRAS